MTDVEISDLMNRIFAEGPLMANDLAITVLICVAEQTLPPMAWNEFSAAVARDIVSVLTSKGMGEVKYDA